VSLDDPLPAGSGVSWSISPAYSGPGACSISGSAPSQTLDCSYGNLAPGASATVHVSSATGPASAGSYPNTATLSASNAANPLQASATAAVLAPALTLTTNANKTPVSTGSFIGFLIVASNSSAAGTGTATSVSLSDPLPAGSGVSWSVTGIYSGTCAITGSPPSQTLSCSFGNLAPGAVERVSISSATGAASAGTYPHTATLAAGNVANPLHASATVVVQAPALSITKTADAATVNAGNPIGFTVTARNSSPAPISASGVSLSDPLPGGAGVSWSISPAYSGPGTCSITGSAPSQTLACSFGTLQAPTASASVHVSSATDASSAGVYPNTATLSATNVSNPVQASASVTVEAQATTIQVTATDDASDTLAGATFQLVDGSNQVLQTCGPTGLSGVCNFSNVGLGSYTVHESVTPTGYATAADQPVTVHASDAGNTIPLAFVDVVQATVQVTKVDGANGGVAGASFELVNGSNQVVQTCGPTGSSGVCTFSGVGLGSYTVHESVTPTGYATAADQPVTVHASDAGNTIPLSFVDCGTAGVGVSLVQATQHFDALNVSRNTVPMDVPMDINANAGTSFVPSVIVDANGVPTSDPIPGPGTTVIPTPFYLGTPITVTAQVSVPTNACAMQFTGATLSGPPGPSAALNAPASPAPVTNGDTLTFAFTPDVGDVGPAPGNYTIDVNLVDGGSSLAPLQIPIHVAGTCGENAPVASFVSPDVPPFTVGVAENLNATATTDADNVPLAFDPNLETVNGCGFSRTLNYNWSYTANGPSTGSFLTANGPVAETNTFTASDPDTYHITLIVDDGIRQSQPVTSDYTFQPAG
jgi:uncharacterized repeat protein (TIGR01451 family)